MCPNTIYVSIITSFVTAILVAGVNHFWNRRYLLIVEREKYRQTLFGEKLKAYVEITTAIHDFTVYAGKIRFKSDKADDVLNQMIGVYDRLMDVKSIIHKHMLIIPEGTLDAITKTSEIFLKTIKITKAEEAINRVEILSNSLHIIIDALRDDLGIDDFGKKLEHKLFHRN